MSKYILLFLVLLYGCKESSQSQIVTTCPKDCSISLKGLTLIRQFEGFVPYIYLDSAGKKTIGYGHLVRDGEDFSYITPEQAEELLRKDVGIAEKAVKQLVTVPITQGQYDALVSFTFNLGYGRLKSSTLLRKLNAGEGASAEFDRWVYAGGEKLVGLILRRKAEQLLFNS